MVLNGKVILLVSSEVWSKIHRSKHHYAMTLAELGNEVFFLNPVAFNLKKGEVRIEPSGVNDNLHIVTYRPFFPWIIKFHLKWLYRVLIRIQIGKILKKIGKRIDIVWDMSCSYLYNDLSIFRAGVKIFHPVDRIGPDVSRKKADIFFSVSPLIISNYKAEGVPKYLINHGLSLAFEPVASESFLKVDYRTKKIQVGYIGTLLIPSFDRELFKKIVLDHSQIDFVLIGPYGNEYTGVKNEYSEDDIQFIDFLKKSPNIVLKGILSSDEIAGEINKYDAFLLCYKNHEHYQSDNSHKILEYLSTGKVIISNEILFYKDSGLIEFATRETPLDVVFNKVINNIDYYNSEELAIRRKAFARSNSYVIHVKRIEELLGKHLQEQNN